MSDFISIKGARENNLNNVDINIPKKKITVFTGVSGSGKSSIVFDTIANEAGRQLNENYSSFVRGFLPKYKKPEVDSIDNLSMSIIIDQKRLGGNSRSTVGTITDINSLLRLLFSRIGSPHIGPAWNFSFNDTHGMCEKCEGIGRIITIDVDKAIDFEKSLNDGAILLPGHKVGTWMWKMYTKTGFFDNDKPIKDYTEEELDKLLYQKTIKVDSLLVDGMNSSYTGIIEKYNTSKSNESESAKKRMEPFLSEMVCSDCNGTRYNDLALSSLINGYNIADMTSMQVDELLKVINDIDNKDVETVIASLSKRLSDLIEIGLDYISLNRETSTLSGGESQRIKMVKYLRSSLVDVCYILDEPSTGLHPRDVHRLNELLIKLRDKGNTVIVVEHDPDVIKVADYIFDIGPKSGKLGGNIVFGGTYKELLSSNTLTGQNMSKRMSFKEKIRESNEYFTTKKSSLHNLKDVSLSVPKNIFTVVTGVAGSGKSTLVNSVFAKQYPDAIMIDQSAVSANVRSNPATYVGVMDDIRKLFAKENDVNVGLFSYNSIGACEACNGNGFIKLELSFMDSVEIVCQECEGKRYKEEVYQYKLNNKTIVDVLNMNFVEALDFFLEKKILKKLQSVIDVGLGYMTLGQQLNTLSGGECQRLKLAKELSKKGNIYIMDEPSTGLHMADIKGILDIIDGLVNKGNTVLVIEHNTDIMRNADWIIDIGIDGGSKGGNIVFEGKPQDIVKCEQSITAKYI